MHENQNIEWKESWRDEYLKWVCGFANANGGKIVIGKNDKGEIVGVSNFKKLMEDIPNKIQNQLGVICDIDLKNEHEKKYIEITVNSYDAPISYRGKYYYRSGSTKQELKGNALTNFLLKNMGKTWDDLVETDAVIGDINVDTVNSFKNMAIKSKRVPSFDDENLEQILVKLRLSKKEKLKRSAILMFGKDPCQFYVNAFVKIGRFGNDDADLRFQEVIEGNMYQLANRTLEVLDEKFLISKISYEGLHRVEKWEYPYEAIREAVINAIVHKDYMGAPIQISVYDEKIIIWNEGRLPDELTIADLKKKHSSIPHNPILASAFFKVGLIEAWGRGTIKILDECKNAGLPEPIIEESFGGISITIFKNKQVKNSSSFIDLNDRQIKAITYLKENHKVTNRIYRELFDITEKTAFRDLEKLVGKNILIKKGHKKDSIYHLNEDVR